MNKYFLLGLSLFLVYNVIYFLLFFHIMAICKNVVLTLLLFGIGEFSSITGILLMLAPPDC
uniref:hypothetical protein n=1 Tax=Acidianus hospitalis TaxID=563177 RepID=UPI00159C0A7D|nr:hypothetical protein [Acidianus hospitalis]